MESGIRAKGRKGRPGSRQGLTLVELIVACALTVLFASCSARVLSSAVRGYRRIERAGRAVQVAETLFGRICGELGRAQASNRPGDALGIGDSSIRFVGRMGKETEISVDEEGYLQVVRRMAGESQEAGDESWGYDEDVYQGYRIGELAFSQPDAQAHPDVIRVDLELTGGSYGSYAASRYIKCYNLEP